MRLRNCSLFLKVPHIVAKVVSFVYNINVKIYMEEMIYGK